MNPINAIDGILLDLNERHDVVEFLRAYEAWKHSEWKLDEYLPPEEARELAPLIFVAERCSVLSRVDPPV